LALPDSTITAGLARAEIAGRLQEVESGLWIDGAHNVQAALALANAIEARAPWVFVVGMSAGKAVADFLAPLQMLGGVLIATEFASERACAAQEVAKAAGGFAEVEVHPRAEVAVRRARKIAKTRPILVTGSLILLGEVLANLGFGPVDPFLVTDPGSQSGSAPGLDAE
jgi:dihydrofolate synthase/folylpolyglutamate synthase